MRKRKELTTREAGVLAVLSPAKAMTGAEIYKAYGRFMPIELIRTSIYVILTRLVDMGLIRRVGKEGKKYSMTKEGKEAFSYYMDCQLIVVGAHADLGVLQALVEARENPEEAKPKPGRRTAGDR